MDLFGQPADYAALAPIAASHGMFMLCDAAQSFGASLDGRRVGTFGRATATSFFPAKPLGCYGDGGAVLTDDDELAAILRSLRVHGQGSNKYDNVRIGINGRLDTIQAAVLLQKLRIFEDEIEARQRIARLYGDLLADVVHTPQVIPGAVSIRPANDVGSSLRACRASTHNRTSIDMVRHPSALSPVHVR